MKRSIFFIAAIAIAIAIPTTQSWGQPTIACPPTQSVGTGTGQCNAFVTYNNPTTPAPTLTHVSGGTGTTQGPTTSTATFNKGTTIVKWKATDAAGNTRTCTFRVIVSDLEAPTLTCPAVPPSGYLADEGTCGRIVTYVAPVKGDNCGTPGLQRIAGPPSGANFPVGTTNVTFQATDGSGNTKRCTFTVTVVDDQPPVVTCPPPVVVAGSGSPCTATAFYANATATDNCSSGLTPFLLRGLASGSSYPAGVTTNTWRAITPNGQSADCSFTVTVTCGAPKGGNVENRDDETKGAANAPSPSHVLTFSLSPNPAAQEAWLDLSATEGLPCAVRLLDVRGTLLQQYPSASGLFRLDLDGVPTGLYFVQLQVPGRVAQVLKLAVERR